MAKTVRGCLTAQSQTEDAKEPHTYTSVPQQEGQADATKGELIADYELNIDYKSGGQTPE